MSDNTKVNPSPIQRNVNDVAMELTNLYYKRNAAESIEEIQKTYAEFYSLADTLHRTNYALLEKFLPEEIKNKIGR